MVIILKALDKERIDEVINVSKEMNRSASKSNRLQWSLTISTHTIASPYHIYDRSTSSSTRGDY